MHTVRLQARAPKRLYAPRQPGHQESYTTLRSLQCPSVAPFNKILTHLTSPECVRKPLPLTVNSTLGSTFPERSRTLQRDTSTAACLLIPDGYADLSSVVKCECARWAAARLCSIDRNEPIENGLRNVHPEARELRDRDGRMGLSFHGNLGGSVLLSADYGRVTRCQSERGFNAERAVSRCFEQMSVHCREVSIDAGGTT